MVHNFLICASFLEALQMLKQLDTYQSKIVLHRISLNLIKALGNNATSQHMNMSNVK